jgi:hypothetical protein
MQRDERIGIIGWAVDSERRCGQITENNVEII